MNVESLFTIDVEEYYHLMGTVGVPPLAEWDTRPVTVEKNLPKLLELLNKHNVKATCFFLGYLAKKHPGLLKDTAALGHDIGSHGMYHQLAFQMSEAEFYQDVADSKHLIEGIIGKEVKGFRSPSFSVTGSNPWFFDALVRAGYKYDSSVFPAQRAEGGLKSDIYVPHWITTSQGKIYEFPISVSTILGKNICFFGGGYLRLFPLSTILKRASQLKAANKPVLFYIHPREIDPHHPRMKVNPLKGFKSYVNLKSVAPKLEAILQTGNFLNLAEYFTKHALTQGE
jgi:polysaccharide deacetylase family protein (PEP-CTERM system associated)